MEKIKNKLLMLFNYLGINKLYQLPILGSFGKKLIQIDSRINEFNRLKNVIDIEEDVDLLKDMMGRYWTEEKIQKNLDELKICYAPWMRLYHSVLIGCSVLQNHKVILDYGCGAGVHSFINKKIFNHCKFYMNDIAMLSSPKLYQSLKDNYETYDLQFVDRVTDDLLSECDLIYSAGTFSVMPPKQLERMLSRFYDNDCDLLVSTNTFLKQDLDVSQPYSKPYNDFREVNWSHNCKKYLNRVGYKIQWLQTLTHDEMENKRLVIFYATKDKQG